MCVGYALFAYVKFLIDSPFTSEEMTDNSALRKVTWSLGDLGLVLCFVTVFLYYIELFRFWADHQEFGASNLCGSEPHTYVWNSAVYMLYLWTVQGKTNGHGLVHIHAVLGWYPVEQSSHVHSALQNTQLRCFSCGTENIIIIFLWFFFSSKSWNNNITVF